MGSSCGSSWWMDILKRGTRELPYHNLINMMNWMMWNTIKHTHTHAVTVLDLISIYHYGSRHSRLWVGEEEDNKQGDTMRRIK